jgi:hypothetical protein
MNTDVSRREFLRRAGIAGLGLAGSANLGVAPRVRAAPAAPAPGDPVTGPLADIYGRIGQPRGLMLSFTSDNVASERTVTWLTSGEAALGSRVQFGVVPSDKRKINLKHFLTREAEGSSELAPRGQFDEDTNSVTEIEGDVEVRVHRATMTGLDEGERIAYRVGGSDAWSDVRVFEPAPRRGESFRFTHLGDHGTRAASRRNTAAVLARRPDFHVIAGDVSYANGWQPGWDRWANEIEPLTGSVPLVPSPGNHEAKDFYGETYRKRFTHPNQGHSWFAFDYHNVHILSTSAGAFLAGQEPATARDFLLDELVGMEIDLAEAAARRAAGEIDFIVVTQHFPLFTNHRTRGPFSPEYVLTEEQILQRYQVDLVAVGHDHMYQRSAAMAYGAPTGDHGGALGYVQVDAGGGGISLYEFTPADFGEIGSDPENAYMQWGSWLEAWAREFSFVEYEVAGPVITGRAFGFADVEGQNDIPQDPATYDQQLVPVDPDSVDPNLAPRQIDEFTLRRKPESVVRTAALPPRAAAEVLRGLPEAKGILVPNLADDCTRHHH